MVLCNCCIHLSFWHPTEHVFPNARLSKAEEPLEITWHTMTQENWFTSLLGLLVCSSHVVFSSTHFPLMSSCTIEEPLPPPASSFFRKLCRSLSSPPPPAPPPSTEWASVALKLSSSQPSSWLTDTKCVLIYSGLVLGSVGFLRRVPLLSKVGKRLFFHDDDGFITTHCSGKMSVLFEWSSRGGGSMSHYSLFPLVAGENVGLGCVTNSRMAGWLEKNSRGVTAARVQGCF